MAEVRISDLPSITGLTGVEVVPITSTGATYKTTVTEINKPVRDETATLLATKAPLASPALTGTPTAPTAVVGDNTTKIATTAFVNAEIDGDRPYATATPNMDGTAAVGTSAKVAREDHIHPIDTSRAPIASPTFTGTPSAPTPTAGDNTTKIATTEFVNTEITNDTDYLADFRVWDATRTYVLNDPVFRNGIPYRSLSASNINNDPATDATNWEIVGGGGSGEVNFLKNDLTKSSVANVTNSGATSVAWDATATDMQIVGALKAIFPASGTGRYLDIALDDVNALDVGRAWWAEFGYKIGTSGDDLVSVYLYDGSVEVPFAGGFLPYAGGTVQVTGGAILPTTVTTGLKLRFKIKDNTAVTLWLADASVGPKSVVSGAAIGEWQSYSPVTNANAPFNESDFRWRRVGSNMEIMLRFRWNTSTAGSGATKFYIEIPSGYTISYVVTNDTYIIQGVGSYSLETTQQARYSVGVRATGSRGLLFSDSDSVEARPLSDFTVGVYVSALVSVPIAQWSANVNLAGDFQEFASNSSSTDADDLTSFVYGSGGAAGVIGITSLTTTRKKRIRFIRPKQATDQLVIELYNPSDGSWNTGLVASPSVGNDVICTYYSHITTNGGMGIAPVPGSLTDFDVLFFETPYGSTGILWNRAPLLGMKWRVRKVSGGNPAEVPPVVFASYRADSILTAVNGAVMNIATKVEDTHNAVTTGAAWRFIAPIPGVYSVKTAVLDGALYSGFYIRKNGSTIAFGGGRGGDVAGGGGSVDVRMNGTTDYIDTISVGNSSGTLDLVTISITRIGG